jgi:hypothetical protein
MAFNFGSGFGVPQQPAFSQFQQAAAPASTFGVQSFGAQPNAPAFGDQGMGGAQGFATPAPNQFSAAGAGFGTGFGAQPNAPAFGAPGMGEEAGRPLSKDHSGSDVAAPRSCEKRGVLRGSQQRLSSLKPFACQ